MVAGDIVTPPVSTGSSKATFSRARLIVGDNRKRLSDKNLEMTAPVEVAEEDDTISSDV